ncbi:hypothetical protein ACOMHN_037812 [Nucella lapillus]
MMWRKMLMAFAVMIYCTTGICGQDLIEQSLGIQDQSLAGKIFKDEISFGDFMTASTVSCADLCFSYAGCVAFTVLSLPADLGVVCRGYASTVTSSFSSVVTPGARLYYVKEMSECSLEDVRVKLDDTPQFYIDSSEPNVAECR